MRWDGPFERHGGAAAVDKAVRPSPPTAAAAPPTAPAAPPTLRRLSLAPRRYNATAGSNFSTIDDGTLQFLGSHFGALPVLLLPGERSGGWRFSERPAPGTGLPLTSLDLPLTLPPTLPLPSVDYTLPPHKVPSPSTPSLSLASSDDDDAPRSGQATQAALAALTRVLNGSVATAAGGELAELGEWFRSLSFADQQQALAGVAHHLRAPAARAAKQLFATEPADPLPEPLAHCPPVPSTSVFADGALTAPGPPPAPAPAARAALGDATNLPAPAAAQQTRQLSASCSVAHACKVPPKVRRRQGAGWMSGVLAPTAVPPRPPSPARRSSCCRARRRTCCRASWRRLRRTARPSARPGTVPAKRWSR